MNSKFLCTTLISISLFQMSAQLAKDKVLHFSAGVLSGGAGALIASELSGGNRFWTFTGAVTGSLMAGTIKEAIDNKNRGSWDNGDLGATVLGGITAGITIDIFTKKNRAKNLKRSQQNQSTLVEKITALSAE